MCWVALSGAGKAAASLEEIVKSNDRVLYDAIVAYVKANGTAKDAEAARRQIVDIAKKGTPDLGVGIVTDEALARGGASAGAEAAPGI